MFDVRAQLKDVGELYKLGEFRAGLLKLQELWNSIPEPKANTPDSFLVIMYAVKISMQAGDLDEAWQWATLAPKYNQARADIGEAEFLVGKVAFERGDMETAREQFVIANKKSRGKAFHGEDPKYKAIVKKT